MAKAKKLKCPKCERTFSMPAHLGRHMRTIHGAKPAAGRRKAAARPRRRVAARVTMTGPTFAADGLVLDLQRYREKLLEQRTKIDEAIAAMDQSINLLGGAEGGAAVKPAAPARRTAQRGRRRGRPRGDGTPREGSLKWYIDKVLRDAGRAMTVKEVTEGVLKAGFKTANQTLGKSVGIALTQMPNVKKIRRGVFALK